MKTDTTLKNSEMEHTLRVRLENANYELVREKEANEKKLKALEIIAKKKVSVLMLNFCFTLSEYNFEVSKDRKLTQEEFDLLKETIKSYVSNNQ